MYKVKVIAVREYLAAVKSKAFILTMVAMPILMSMGIVAEHFLKGRVDTGDKRVAIIDRTGKLFDRIEKAAEQRNATDIFEKFDDAPPKQVGPRFLVEKATLGGGDIDDALLALSQRVRDEELLAFVMIESDVLDPTDLKQPDVLYYSNKPTYRDFRYWIEGVVTQQAQQWRFEQSGLDPQKVAWALQPTDVENLGLFTKDAETGAIVPAEEVNDMTMIVPVFMIMLLFAVIMMGAGPLIQSVIEEKSLRIAEVLLGSLTPFQWMLGKLIGMVGVSLTVVLVYLIGGYVVAVWNDVTRFIPFDLLGWFAAYQVLAVLMFGAVFIAIGSACTDHREAQSAIMPVMIIIVLPMMMFANVLRDPTSTFSVVVSLFPPSTPMLMLIRQSVPPGVPLWQAGLGMFLVLVTTVLCVFAAGRIFRVGVLMQGKGAKPSDMIRWVLKG